MKTTNDIIREIEANENPNMRIAFQGLSIRIDNEVKFFSTVEDLKAAVAQIESENLYSLNVTFSKWMFLQMTVTVSYLKPAEIGHSINAVKIARNVNAFDLNFQKIDEGGKFKFWSDLHNTIQQKIDGLTDAEIQSLRALVNENISIFKVRAIKQTSQKSSVFKTAWELVKKTNKPLPVCLSRAWSLYRLRKRMAVEVVTITYEKVDGSVRKAKATLQNVASMIKGTGKENQSLFNYFDVDANAFRSFKIENLISIF